MSIAIRRLRRAATPLGTREELRGAHAPRQARSVEVLQRIAGAGRELFLSLNYEIVSIADIAAASGVSVGTFYTRFPSKERLVAYLVAELADELRDRMSAGLDPARWRGATRADVIRWYLHEMAGAFLQYRGLLRPATLIARQTEDAEIRPLLSRFNTEVHGRFRELVLQRWHADTRVAHATAVDVTLLMISATMREVLLYGEPVSRLAPGHRELIEHLTASASIYLDSL